jgi:hypothetical protein
MCKLREQGLMANHVNSVFYAIILPRIIYGVCAWSGLLSVELIERIDAFFVVRLGTDFAIASLYFVTYLVTAMMRCLKSC